MHTLRLKSLRETLSIIEEINFGGKNSALEHDKYYNAIQEKNAKTNDKEENKKSMSHKALLKRTIRMKMLLVLVIFIHSPCI